MLHEDSKKFPEKFITTINYSKFENEMERNTFEIVITHYGHIKNSKTTILIQVLLYYWMQKHVMQKKSGGVH